MTASVSLRYWLNRRHRAGFSVAMRDIDPGLEDRLSKPSECPSALSQIVLNVPT